MVRSRDIIVSSRHTLTVIRTQQALLSLFFNLIVYYFFIQFVFARINTFSVVMQLHMFIVSTATLLF